MVSMRFPGGLRPCIQVALIVSLALCSVFSAQAQSRADLNNDQDVDADDWLLAEPCVFGPDNSVPGLDNALLWDNMAGDRLAATFTSEVDISVNPVTLGFAAVKRRTGGGKDYLFVGESTAGAELFRLKWANSGQVLLSIDGGNNEISVLAAGTNQAYLSSSLWNPATAWTFELTLDSDGIDVTVNDAVGNSGTVTDIVLSDHLLGKLVFTSAAFGGTGGIWIDEVAASASGLGVLFQDGFNNALIGDATMAAITLGIENGGVGDWQADPAQFADSDAAIVAATLVGACQPATFARMDFDGDADVDQPDMDFFFQEFTSANTIPTVDYYVDADGGNNNLSGTSPTEAWATLSRASTQPLQPGDRILLQAGDTFVGKLKLSGLSGSATHPIVVASYGDGPKPLINAAGYFAGVELENVHYIEVRDLEITADGGATVDGSDPAIRSGVHVAVGSGSFSNITIDNLEIHDVYPETDTAHEGTNPTTYTGYGVRIRGANFEPHIVVKNCDIQRVGFKAIEMNRLQYVDILSNTMKDIGGPAIQPGRVNDLVMRHNVVDGSGSYVDPRMHGRGSGTWPWTCERVLIEHNAFMHARGKADSCGAHIDFNCKDVVVQYNFSMDNEGGFVEILGNCTNCAYRYNISVNDGARVNGVNGADQWGYSLFFSGYAGATAPRVGPFNSYIYNNTIYVKSDQQANFAFHESAQGILIANNIFYIEGLSANVTPGAQDDWTQQFIDGVVWQNNLYQRSGIIPAAFPFTDSAPVIDNPAFRCTGGLDPTCYIPLTPVVQDAGIAITPIPGDSIGLRIGLSVTEDFLGNPITGLPDFGAIEYDPNYVDDPNCNPDPNQPTALLSEDFATWSDPENMDAPFPPHTWHMNNANSWEKEDPGSTSSVMVTNDAALRTGWGYDEVVTRYYTDVSWDLCSDYLFEGTWEIANTLDVHLGLIVGFGEYEVTTGALLNRIKEITVGETDSPTSGQSGAFSLSVSSSELQSAGVDSSNCVGIFFHHNDDGALYNETSSDRNDVYVVDDLQVTRVAGP